MNVNKRKDKLAKMLVTRWKLPKVMAMDIADAAADIFSVEPIDKNATCLVSTKQNKVPDGVPMRQQTDSDSFIEDARKARRAVTIK